MCDKIMRGKLSSNKHYLFGCSWKKIHLIQLISIVAYFDEIHENICLYFSEISQNNIHMNISVKTNRIIISY